MSDLAHPQNYLILSTSYPFRDFLIWNTSVAVCEIDFLEEDCYPFAEEAAIAIAIATWPLPLPLPLVGFTPCLVATTWLPPPTQLSTLTCASSQSLVNTLSPPSSSSSSLSIIIKERGRLCHVSLAKTLFTILLPHHHFVEPLTYTNAGTSTCHASASMCPY